jgi:hypothetical protein
MWDLAISPKVIAPARNAWELEPTQSSPTPTDRHSHAGTVGASQCQESPSDTPRRLQMAVAALMSTKSFVSAVATRNSDAFIAGINTKLIPLIDVFEAAETAVHDYRETQIRKINALYAYHQEIRS